MINQITIMWSIHHKWIIIQFWNIFGAVRVFYVRGFTLYEMGDTFITGVSEGGRVCACGRFSVGVFYVE